MNDDILKIYKVYEYIRDSEFITERMSNTKRIILKLLDNDKKMIKYCDRKILEERQEVEDAKVGEHFHSNMTKREILVNEISQYMYWLIIVDISRRVSYKNSKVQDIISEILSEIDIRKIGENVPISIEEIVEHDLEEMKTKNYLKEVIK